MSCLTVTKQGHGHEEDWEFFLAVGLILSLLYLNGHVGAFLCVAEGETGPAGEKEFRQVQRINVRADVSSHVCGFR